MLMPAYSQAADVPYYPLDQLIVSPSPSLVNLMYLKPLVRVSSIIEGLVLAVIVTLLPLLKITSVKPLITWSVTSTLYSMLGSDSMINAYASLLLSCTLATSGKKLRLCKT